MDLQTLIFVFSSTFISIVSGHGYLVKPPARNSMWRFGFRNPPNYNDNQLFCGGSWKQNAVNKGRCGICGDDASEKDQPHMDGGIYANNIITETYRKGQVITVKVKLTAAHKGFFEFRIGQYDNKVIEGDYFGRLRGELLKQANGTNKYLIGVAKLYSIHLNLPPALTCERCVLQWWYRAGNNWGCDWEGCGLGHGDQENFVNCADISIY